MKQYFLKRLMVAGFVMLAVPATLLAQKEKEEKDKNDVEQIIITRKGDSKDKTVIEINGDRVTVNGKNVDDIKDGDVTVRRNKVRDFSALARTRVANGQGWNFEFDNDRISLFSEDENRAMLGVNTEVNSEDKVKGVKITSVVKESAAEKAGLKKGDIITKINDKTIDANNSITSMIKSNKPGDKVTVTYLRDGKEQKATAELGKWKGVNINTMAPTRIISPDVYAPATPGQSFGGTVYYGGQPRLGLSVQDSEDGKGVKILSVAEESNAAKAGLKKDDIITHINDKEVNSADEVSRVVRENREKISMMMKVQRNGKAQNIEVRTPRRLKTANL